MAQPVVEMKQWLYALCQRVLPLVLIQTLGCNGSSPPTGSTERACGLEVIDTVVIRQQMYRFALDSKQHLYVLSTTDTTLLSDNDAIAPRVEPVDLDQDGTPELIVGLYSNTPGDELHFRFDSHQQGFVPLKDDGYYANARPLKGTGLSYTYNRAGCADYSWESWLFGIRGDRAYSLGHMVADICPGDQDPHITVRLSVANEDLTLVDSLGADTSLEFLNGKWGLIEHYWTSRYKLFLRDP